MGEGKKKIMKPERLNYSMKKEKEGDWWKRQKTFLNTKNRERQRRGADLGFAESHLTVVRFSRIEEERGKKKKEEEREFEQDVL